MIVLVVLAVVLAALILTGCSSSAETSGSESGVPTNVLPEDGSPIVYEFYTDT